MEKKSVMSDKSLVYQKDQLNNNASVHESIQNNSPGAQSTPTNLDLISQKKLWGKNINTYTLFNGRFIGKDHEDDDDKEKKLEEDRKRKIEEQERNL